MPKIWLWTAASVLVLGSFVLLLKQCSGPRPLAVHDALDADGVRADVAAEIAKAFPESEKKRAAATQLARALQRGIDKPDDAIEIYALWERAATCLSAVEGLDRTSAPTETSSLIEGWVVNTTARSRAYIHYNAGLGGRILKGSGIDPGSCDFDPGAMSN